MVEFTYRHRTGKKKFKMEGPNNADYIINYINSKKSFYEIDLLEYMDFITRDENRDNAVCIDVGANIGNHSVYMGSYIGKRILSVEPNSRLYKALYYNLKNNINDYIVAECAIGESQTKGKIIFPVDSDASMSLARVEVIDSKDKSSDFITIQTLDALVDTYFENKKDKVFIIKVDVEGNELSVLKGAQETIKIHHPHLFVEVCRPELKEDLDNYLSIRHYLPISRWAGTPVYHYVYKPTIQQRIKAKLFTVKYKLVTRHVKSIKRRLKIV